MTTMMPPLERRETCPELDADVDARALAYVIDATHDDDLFAEHLAGETVEEREARLAAAADITEELLYESTEWGWAA